MHLLFLFIILSLINKNSVFHNINCRLLEIHHQENQYLHYTYAAFLSGLSAVNAQKLVPDKAVSEEFGKVLVQDQKGRTKPLFTLSNDILQKGNKGE